MEVHGVQGRERCGMGKGDATGGREGKEKGKREKEKKERERGKKEKRRRWKGIFAKTENGKRVAVKTQGVGKEKARGRIRVCSRVCLAGLLGLTSWAALSRTRNLFFFCKLIWQIILENGDDRPGKIFSDNFRKIK